MSRGCCPNQKWPGDNVHGMLTGSSCSYHQLAKRIERLCRDSCCIENVLCYDILTLRKHSKSPSEDLRTAMCVNVKL